MQFRIVAFERKHIDEVVEAHIRAFPTFFLTFLGRRFMKEVYASYLFDDAGMSFVAEEEPTGSVLGIVVGPLAPDGYFKRLLKRRWWAFCLASIRTVLRRPSTIRRLVRAVFYRGQSPSGPKRSLLSSISVSPEYQGHGIGRALMDAWVAEARRRGSGGCYVMTDRDNNEGSNCFYPRVGWKIESTFPTPEGRAMNRYVLDFPDARQEQSPEPDHREP